MTDQEKSTLKSVLMTLLLGQTIGGLNGLASPLANKKRQADVRKVEEYAAEILRQAGVK